MTAPNDTTTVPSFVLRDYWIDGRISSEQYAAEVARRNDAQSDLVEENRRLRGLLEEARKLADMAIDCVTTDVTMQGTRVTGVNGSAARRASEMARSFLSNLEAQQP